MGDLLDAVPCAAYTPPCPVPSPPVPMSYPACPGLGLLLLLTDVATDGAWLWDMLTPAWPEVLLFLLRGVSFLLASGPLSWALCSLFLRVQMVGTDVTFIISPVELESINPTRSYPLYY